MGGVAAQCTQALASFALQFLAVRMLGLDGLGRFAAVFAFIVLATALVSGFVGDSLTVLNRRDLRVRAALQRWWLSLSVLVGCATGVVSWLVGLVDGRTAWIVGVAAGIFVLEDTLRRLLMASMLFWRIVVVDLAGLIAALTTLWVVWQVQGELDLSSMFGAIAVGQAVGLVVAGALLPRAERFLAPWRPASLRTVAAYGAWRSVQQGVKPAMLALVRTVGIAVLSASAVGELEAARIYIAPTLIVVGGLSTVLFAGFARQAAPLRELMRQADRIVPAFICGALALATVEVLLLPWLAPLLTGGEYELSTMAIYGWAAYATAVAAVAPYSTLAAVRGRQWQVAGLRVVESLLSVSAVACVLLLGATIFWAPWLLASGALAGGVALRVLLTIRAQAETEVRSAHD